MAAPADVRPRFFKVFISHFCADDMVIPIAYYSHLPDLLPETAILQGPGGDSWKVAIKFKPEEKEVCFGPGWPKFVEDNTLSDGDFLTFMYNGDHIFEVSIYRSDGCKETGEDSEEEDDKEDSVYSVSTEKDTDTCSESEMAYAIPKYGDKGKSKVKVEEDSDEEEDSLYSLSSEESEDTDTDSCSESKMAKTVRKNKNKGKKKDESVEESDGDSDSDSDYTEAFGDLDIKENAKGDTFSPNNEETTTCVKPKVKNLKKIEAAQKRKKVEPKIKNPEKYLDNPDNIHFETNVKNRLYELLVHAQLVKDYCLKFGDYIKYIDQFGTVKAKTAKWKDQRVCIKRWNRICKRNKLEREDRVLCELLRRRDFVYAIKVHVIRARNL